MKKKTHHYKDPLRHLHPASSVILSGYRSRLSEFSVKPPLFRTSTFEFPKAKDGEKFFQRAYHLPGDDGKDPGLIYSRLNNPSVEIVEDKLVAAEKGASHALLFPSGMGAISTSVLALVPQGGRILYSDPVYGGTYLFFREFCRNRFGIEAVPVDTSDLSAVERALRTRGPFHMVYIETPSNPTMKLSDIGACSRLARKHCGKDVIVAVDNTFLGPVFQRPFDWGVDLVLYSATKFLGGHSDIIAGVALTARADLNARIRDFRTILGATPAPDTAWLLTRSIETLWVRMQRQAEKAVKVARAVRRHPEVARVSYPGLLGARDGDQYRIYRKQCLGPGSMFAFELRKNTRERAYRMLDRLKIFHLAVSLGGTESLIEHPRSMTHSDMAPEDLDRAGITEGMIRVSVGLESSEDLITDLRAAMRR